MVINTGSVHDEQCESRFIALRAWVKTRQDTLDPEVKVPVIRYLLSNCFERNVIKARAWVGYA